MALRHINLALDSEHKLVSMTGDAGRVEQCQKAIVRTGDSSPSVALQAPTLPS